MSLGRYLLAAVLLVLLLGPIGAGAVRLRARLLPAWSGPPARVAEAVAALSLLLGVVEVLGAVGLFEPAPVVLGGALAGGALFGLAGRLHAREPAGRVPPGPGPGPDRATILLALLGVALVAAEWCVETIDALDGGMTGSDTLAYHGPVAARFAELGSLTMPHYVNADSVIAYFPANSETLHAVGILLAGRDVLSPLLALGWLALALSAAWAIGRPWGAGPASVLGACLLLGSPALVGSQPGEALTDVVCFALILAAGALLVNGDVRGAALALAGLAAGLAIGTKVVMAAPVVALTAGVLVIAVKRRRPRDGALWIGALVLSGSFWYVRNLVRFGSPLPAVKVGLGAVAFPAAPAPGAFSVAHYLFDGDIWRLTFLPGLHDAFGPAWWLVLALAAAGLVLAVARGATAAVRLLGAVGLVSVVAYVFTPRSADGVEGYPLFFAFTLRYVTPALALGLVLLPADHALAPLARRWWWAAGAFVLLVVTLSPSGWPLSSPARAATLVVLVAGGAAAAVALSRQRAGRGAVAFALVAGVAILVAGWPIARHYLDTRYADRDAWARDLRDTRIAVVGEQRQYPLYGRDLSNRVEYIGVKGAHGAFLPVRDCRAWLAALARGAYAYVVVTPPQFPYPFGKRSEPEIAWSRADPALRPVVDHGRAQTVFRVSGPIDPGRCR